MSKWNFGFLPLDLLLGVLIIGLVLGGLLVGCAVWVF